MRKKELVAGIVLGLVLGLGIGCGFTIQRVEQRVSDLQEQVNTLHEQLSVRLEQISALQSQISGISNQIANLQSQVEDGNEEIANLQSQMSELESGIEELQRDCNQFFFIKDPHFTVPLDSNVFWDRELWNNPNPDSVVIQDGKLWLFYNETQGIYGNAGVFQGKHADSRRTHDLWIGKSDYRGNFSEYLELSDYVQKGKFWLRAGFRLNQIGFNCYPNVTKLGYPVDPFARVNLGITLMCAIGNEEFSLGAKTLWLDVYFAGFNLNETHIWSIPKDYHYVFDNPVSGDLHGGYWTWQTDPVSDPDKWFTVKIDLGRYIGETLKDFRDQGVMEIEKIRIFGFILFLETIGSYAEAEYDFIETCIS